MANREDTLSVLKDQIHIALGTGCTLVKIPLYVAFEIAELLKEQEPVEPRKILPCITRPVGGYVCGHCGIRFLEKNDYYCSNCGRAVKWEND